jgi:spermidine synthase
MAATVEDPSQGTPDDEMTSRAPPGEAPAQVLLLLDDAFAFAQQDDMETVDSILADVVDVVGRTAPLPSTAWDEVRQAHMRLEHEIAAATERIRVQLGAAGGGRRASNRYGALAPPTPTSADGADGSDGSDGADGPG